LAQPTIDLCERFQQTGVEADPVFHFFEDTKRNRRGKNADSGADTSADSHAAGGVAELAPGLSTAGMDSPPDEPPIATQRRNAIRSLATAQPPVAAAV
jgi:hypothetical protein